MAYGYLKANLNDIKTVNTKIDSKIKSIIFTATVANTTNIVHNFSGYDNTHDELTVTDLAYGSILTKGIEYAENNNTSIDLLGWGLAINESIKIVLIKNIK